MKSIHWTVYLKGLPMVKSAWIIAWFALGWIGVSRAELPPSAYEKMQMESPEVLRINVLRVDQQRAQPTEISVTILAEIIKVGRSKSGLKPGDVINIVYAVTQRPKGFAGPGPVPILPERLQTVAYLRKTRNSADYEPAAGAMSFSNF